MKFKDIPAAIQNELPWIRNVVSYGCGALTAIGVLHATDQATLLDAITHIGADVQDILKYVGIIVGITMPIWAKVGSSVIGLLTSLKRKAPEIKSVAPPDIAAKTPDNVLSDTQVKIVPKV